MGRVILLDLWCLNYLLLGLLACKGVLSSLFSMAQPISRQKFYKSSLHSSLYSINLASSGISISVDGPMISSSNIVAPFFGDSDPSCQCELSSSSCCSKFTSERSSLSFESSVPRLSFSLNKWGRYERSRLFRSISYQFSTSRNLNTLRRFFSFSCSMYARAHKNSLQLIWPL